MTGALRWLLTPSGGPVAPGFWGTVDGIKRRPLVAHPVGAALVVLAFRLLVGSSAPAAFMAALLAEGVNQFYKAVRGVYGSRTGPEVFWRMVLAAAGAGLACL